MSNARMQSDVAEPRRAGPNMCDPVWADQGALSKHFYPQMTQISEESALVIQTKRRLFSSASSADKPLKARAKIFPE